MSFCSDSNEVAELIEECRAGDYTERELIILILGRIAYKCDSPHIHGNCYEDRCLNWAQQLYDFLEESKE